jgi:hypothetical protein
MIIIIIISFEWRFGQMHAVAATALAAGFPTESRIEIHHTVRNLVNLRKERKLLIDGRMVV